MVVDSSALIAIVLGEPEEEEFAKTIVRVRDPVVSAVSLVECAIVMHLRTGASGLAQLDRAVEIAGLRPVPVDMRQVDAARTAWTRYGRGDSPARLNFGDCFSYALAVTLRRPLLYKGGDFGRTDVIAAA